MRPRSFVAGLMFSLFGLALLPGCTSPENESTRTESEKSDDAAESGSQSMAAKGEYLVMIGGCADCHTPKTFDQAGMHFDSSRMLSGYPANDKLFNIEPDALKPGTFIQMAPGINAFAGPWGVSFAANLTPDSATGLGTWTEEIFIRTLRTGKHMGVATGRDILPPMPWFNFVNAKEEDLKAIYAYLRSLPPISNKVPMPIPPNEVKPVAGQ